MEFNQRCYGHFGPPASYDVLPQLPADGADRGPFAWLAYSKCCTSLGKKILRVCGEARRGSKCARRAAVIAGAWPSRRRPRGRIVASGGPELADELENTGYAGYEEDGAPT
jgi:hypothetical protein